MKVRAPRLHDTFMVVKMRTPKPKGVGFRVWGPKTKIYWKHAKFDNRGQENVSFALIRAFMKDAPSFYPPT